MRFGYREECLSHHPGSRHPEHPDRLRAVRAALSQSRGVSYETGSTASVEIVTKIHESGYVADLRTFCQEGGGHWDGDTVAGSETWTAALASVGLARWAAEAALDKARDSGVPFSLGRPPGHHALADDAMGFCFLNNAAVAAQVVLDRPEVDRVAVVDWDVHHGNGTQNIFYDRRDVFYGSIHERGLYPGTGDIEEHGAAEGFGTTVNIPLESGRGTADYVAAFDEVLRPALTAYDPDLLLVSAGFDGHERDPISRHRVTADGYGLLADRVRSVARDVMAPLAFVLEGGYDLEALAESVRTLHDVFEGYEPAEPEPPDTVSPVIEAARRAHGLGEK